MKELIQIIEKAKNDLDALQKIKNSKVISKIKTLKTCVHNVHFSALGKAAELGYIEVLKYLIEVKGADPQETYTYPKKTDVEKVSAIEVAIKFGKIDAAVYLISKSNKDKFLKDIEGRCLPATLAVDSNFDYVEIIEALEKLDKNLITMIDASKSKATLLHRAACFGRTNITQHLLESRPLEPFFDIDNNGNTPYEYALDDLNEIIISKMLELGANPIAAKIAEFETKPLKYIDEADKSAKTDEEKKAETTLKRKCANMLLAAGAGLDINEIPPNILTLLNLDKIKSQLGPFLLIGEQKQTNGTWKNKLFTHLTDFNSCFQNLDNWRFKTKQLARTILEPSLQKLPHVQAISTLLKLNQIALDDLPLLKMNKNLSNYIYDDRVLHQKNRQNMPEDIMFQHMLENMRLLQVHANKLNQYIEDKINSNACFTDDELKKTFKEYFDRFNFVAELLKKPDCQKVLKDNKWENSFSWAMGYFIKLFEKISKCLPAIDSTESEKLNINQFRDLFCEIACTYLGKMLKKYGSDIKKHDPENYSNLNYMNSFLASTNAENNLFSGNVLIAIDYAIQSIELLEEVNEDCTITINPYEVPQFKALNRMMLANAYLSQGWVKEANKTYKTAFKLFVHGEDMGLFYDIAMINYKYLVIELNSTQSYNSEVAEILKGYLCFHEKMVDIIKPFEESYAIQKKSCELFYIKYLVRQIAEIDAKFSKNNNAIPSPPLPKNNNENKEKDETEELIEKLKASSIEYNATPKIKVKTRNPANLNNNSNIIIEPNINSNNQYNFGFEIPEGYSPPIPVKCNFLPENTFFITLPINNPNYLPFLKKVQDQNTKEFHDIQSISKYGKNQQGVKFGTVKINNNNNNNNKPIEVSRARMKIFGANGEGKLRATGFVQQEVTTADNRKLRLYAIDKIEEKKDEMRSNYGI